MQSFIWEECRHPSLATYPGTLCGLHLNCSPIWSCSGWGLPSHKCYQLCGVLLPHLFTFTSKDYWQFVLCCTFRRLTPPRCYLASCPWSPDFPLSIKTATAQPTPSYRLSQTAFLLN